MVSPSAASSRPMLRCIAIPAIRFVCYNYSWRGNASSKSHPLSSKRRWIALSQQAILKKQGVKMRAFWTLVAAALLVGGPGQAKAEPIPAEGSGHVGWTGVSGPDPQFLLTFSGSGVNGSALLDAIDNGNGIFTATSGSGTVAGPANAGILTLFPNPNAPNATISPSGFFIYNDLLYPGQSPLVDVDGPLFTLPNNVEVNIFNNDNGPNQPPYLYYDNTGFNVPVSVSLTLVPEPAGLILLGFGILGLFGHALSRKANRRH
jgi:hypothetical protein